MGDASKSDRYVTGGTNWDSYDLPQLIAMVTDKVDIPALVSLADDWRWTGDGMAESARDLADALDGLMLFWSGEASRKARTDVALNAQWLSDLGTTAYEIGTPVEDAAGALRAAQNQMPQVPVTPTEIAPGSAPDAAAAAERVGGPLGAALGAAAAGSESAAQAAEEQISLKRQAVETMRRFETAAIGIDQAIPRFEGPSPVLRSRAMPRPVYPPPIAPLPELPERKPTWDELTGRPGSGTTAQNYAPPSGGGANEPARESAGVPAHGGGGAGSHPVSGGGRVTGPGFGTGAAPPPERAPGVPAAASAALVDPDGPGAMGGGAAPMGGMGAGAGTKDDDHRRRYPFDAEGPFSPERKASPPVIGI